MTAADAAALASVERCSWSIYWLVSGFSTLSFDVQLESVWGDLPCSLERMGEGRQPMKRAFTEVTRVGTDLTREKTIPRAFWGCFLWLLLLWIPSALKSSLSAAPVNPWMSTYFLLSQLIGSSLLHEYFYISLPLLTSGYRKITPVPKSCIFAWCHFIPGQCTWNFANITLVTCQLKE